MEVLCLLLISGQTPGIPTVLGCPIGDCLRVKFEHKSNIFGVQVDLCVREAALGGRLTIFLTGLLNCLPFHLLDSLGGLHAHGRAPYLRCKLRSAP